MGATHVLHAWGRPSAACHPILPCLWMLPTASRLPHLPPPHLTANRAITFLLITAVIVVLWYVIIFTPALCIKAYPLIVEQNPHATVRQKLWCGEGGMVAGSTQGCLGQAGRCPL